MNACFRGIAALIFVAGAMAAWSGQPAAGSAPRVTVSGPADATEGAVVALTTRIASARSARQIALQHWDQPYLSLAGSWKTIAKAQVRNHATRRWAVVADSMADGRFRAVVTYAGRKRPAISAAAVIRYWHWTPLTKIAAYQTAGSAYANDYGSFNMNGATATGWTSTGGESRYTIGRNCKEFKALAGLTDTSKDGSSGSITISTIDQTNTVSPIWVSPTLVPGTSTPVDLVLAAPYRLSIAGSVSQVPLTPGSTYMVPNATVALADAELLCHFSS